VGGPILYNKIHDKLFDHILETRNITLRTLFVLLGNLDNLGSESGRKWVKRGEGEGEVENEGEGEGEGEGQSQGGSGSREVKVRVWGLIGQLRTFNRNWREQELVCFTSRN